MSKTNIWNQMFNSVNSFINTVANAVTNKPTNTISSNQSEIQTDIKSTSGGQNDIKPTSDVLPDTSKLIEIQTNIELTIDASLTKESDFFLTKAGQIRKGGYIIIKNRPCKVIDFSTAKTGKHGHAKCLITAIDIFTGKKYEDSMPSTHEVPVPTVIKKEYQLIDINDEGFTSLMVEDGNTIDDIKLPENTGLAKKIIDAFDTGKDISVTVLSAMGNNEIISLKEVTSQ